MAVTGTYTVRDLVTDAARKLGVVNRDEGLTESDTTVMVRQMDRMLKHWQNRGWLVWTVAEQTVTLTTAASYTLSPVRPLDILDARLVRNSIETPMLRMTREEYDNLPDKAATGLPTQFYYDRQREAALFYVWPVLATADGETVKVTYNREIEDTTSLNATPDIPGEWWDAVVYNLADRLQHDYEVSKPEITMMADRLLREALAFDREGSVYFSDDFGHASFYA